MKVAGTSVAQETALAATRKGELFDEWPQRYEAWFTTPIGALVKQYEAQLLDDLLNPQPGDSIVDAGCGSGIFTTDFCLCGARVWGVDRSAAMLQAAQKRLRGHEFVAIRGDIRALPVASSSVAKAVSMTAVEFVHEAHEVVAELHRVVRPGGTVVLATLNSLSPWAARRRQKARRGHSLFRDIVFRSPDELRALAPPGAQIRSVIHFQDDDEPGAVPAIEERGRERHPFTGALVAAVWQKA